MFPNLSYDAKGDGRETIMKDIFPRVKLTTQNQLIDFDYYDVQDGEAPEIIAHKYYGDVELHWCFAILYIVVIKINQLILCCEFYPRKYIFHNGFSTITFSIIR
jgi:hypothetical protein